MNNPQSWIPENQRERLGSRQSTKHDRLRPLGRDTILTVQTTA